MDRSIQEVARLAGTTSRTLRHDDAVGLLKPARIGPNGYRRYDGAALVRPQRRMPLREMGMGLPSIAGFLSGEDDDVRALERHLAGPEVEQGRRRRRSGPCAPPSSRRGTEDRSCRRRCSRVSIPGHTARRSN